MGFDEFFMTQKNPGKNHPSVKRYYLDKLLWIFLEIKLKIPQGGNNIVQKNAEAQIAGSRDRTTTTMENRV